MPCHETTREIILESGLDNLSSPSHSSLFVDLVPSGVDIWIALRKGVRCCTIHLISNFVSYHRLSSYFFYFCLSHFFHRSSKKCIGIWLSKMDNTSCGGSQSFEKKWNMGTCYLTKR